MNYLLSDKNVVKSFSLYGERTERSTTKKVGFSDMTFRFSSILKENGKS